MAGTFHLIHLRAYAPWPSASQIMMVHHCESHKRQESLDPDELLYRHLQLDHAACVWAHLMPAALHVQLGTMSDREQPCGLNCQLRIMASCGRLHTSPKADSQAMVNGAMKICMHLILNTALATGTNPTAVSLNVLHDNDREPTLN